MSRERKIGRHHLAFYRGWLQGGDVRSLADHYLETGLDLRVAKSTLRWVRDTIRQAALRHKRYSEARLLRARLTAPKVSGRQGTAARPSLEEFRETRDPSGFYGEDELIALYLGEYPDGVDKRGRQRRRLMDRQLAALSWIEPLLSTAPVPADPVLAWFDGTITDRLAGAGITTLGDLIALIEDRGYRWYTRVPGMGEKGAERIVGWLRGYESSLGALPDYALTPARTASRSAACRTPIQTTGIVPFEAFAAPVGLSGTTGSNRYPGRPRIDALNDYHAIQVWLEVKAGNAHTLRAYRKEAERLLLWAIIERGKALSDLSIEDCAKYRDWISMLGRTIAAEWPFRVPQVEWIGKRGVARFSAAWRPFDGPISDTSVRQAITVVASLFEWLVRVQYCGFNPWDAVNKSPAQPAGDSVDTELTRVFSQSQWRHLIDCINSRALGAHTHRLRFVLPFAQATGLRLSELVDAKVGRLYTMPLQDTLGVRWMLKVIGKGGRWRAVPIPDRIVALLSDYLVYRDLYPDPLRNAPETPLIARLRSNDAISPSGLYKVLRDAFRGVADDLRAEGREQEAKSFDRATVHWLRHTCGSHLGSAGVPANLVQKLLGHASLATTSIYTEPDDERLWLEVTNHAK